jgi:hypothetical protein
MIDWQITAKTIYCEAVDDEVTLMVYRDRPARCTGCKKYAGTDSTILSLIKEKSKRLKRPVRCEGDNCLRLNVYREQILNEKSGTDR